jgi:hypothetical protein
MQVQPATFHVSQLYRENKQIFEKTVFQKKSYQRLRTVCHQTIQGPFKGKNYSGPPRRRARPRPMLILSSSTSTVAFLLPRRHLLSHPPPRPAPSKTPAEWRGTRSPSRNSARGSARRSSSPRTPAPSRAAAQVRASVTPHFSFPRDCRFLFA